MEQQISLLDCTIRDGSYALEGAKKFRFKDKKFDKKIISEILNNLCESSVEIVELGTVEHLVEDKLGYAIYGSLEEICKTIPKNKKKNQLTSVFFRGPDIPLECIPEHTGNLCDIIRLSIRYSELKKSLEYCKKLCLKGYKVSIQPAITMRYSENELDEIIKYANDMHAFSVYIVDTYGYMEKKDLRRLYKKFDDCLEKEVKIGFHAHNNLQLAMLNSVEFLEIKTNRSKVIDSCCMGMGQGAGNLHTEIIMPFLNESYAKNYQWKAIIRNCELLEPYWEKNMWGYSVATALSAIYKVAYGYALALEFDYKYSLTEILRILSRIPKEAKHRYTKVDLERAIKIYNNFEEKFE